MKMMKINKNFPRPCPSNMNSEYNHPTINHKGWTPHEKHNAIGHIQCSVRPRGASSIWILWYGVGVLFGAQFFLYIFLLLIEVWGYFSILFEIYRCRILWNIFFNAKNLFFREFDKFRLVLDSMDGREWTFTFFNGIQFT